MPRPSRYAMTRLLLLLLIPASAPVVAQGQTPDSAAARQAARAVPPLPSFAAHRREGAIRVDGKLDDAAWAATPATSGFVQVDPENGAPATEQTEVRVLYDDDALYIAARMFDSEPSKIRARLGRRDESLSNADLVEFYLDPYYNRVDGYVFRITPAGAIRDAVMLAGGGQDQSWDAVWESAARVDSLGWVAELRIPFSQLRYNAAPGAQRWGVQVVRTVARKNEQSQLAYTPRHMAGGPQRWGTLEDLRDLPRARHAELLPYVTSRAEYLHVAPGNPFRGAQEYALKAGADFRVGLGSSTMLSATVNPDFGQVEVDPARVNLSANELFFPERRPFFVAGSDLFRYGRINAFNNRGTPTVFHSRRIGRQPQRSIASRYAYTDAPDEATIASAVKITGRTRGGLAAGVLNAITLRETADWVAADGSRGSDVVEPFTNYFAARARQEVNSGNTRVGAMATAVNRALGNDALASVLRRDAYFVGADLNHAFRQRMYTVDASLGYSKVGGSATAIAATQRSPVHYLQRPDLQTLRYDPTRTSLEGYQWQLAAAKNAGKHTIASIAWQGVSPGFETNDVGFQSSSAFQALSTVLGFKSDVPNRLLRNYLVGPFSGQAWNFDGDLTDSYVGFHIDGRLRNFWGFNLNVVRPMAVIDDRLTRGGPVVRRPAGRAIEFNFNSDQRRIYLVGGGVNAERFESGQRSASSWIELTIRPSSALRVSVEPTYERATYTHQYLRQAADSTARETFGTRYVFGELAYNQLSLNTRVDWTFSPTLSLQMFAQPLVADGEYSNFKSLTRNRTFDFSRHTEADGTLLEDDNGYVVRGSAAGSPAIRIGSPDFSSRALVGNAVMRWEYRPGSAVFLVWQQRRAGDDGIAGFEFARDLRGAFRERPENVFAVKATYWIGR